MEKKIKELEKELKYLTDKAIEEEINKNKNRLEQEEIKDIVNDIYLSRGLDINKIKGNISNNVFSDLVAVLNGFRNKDKVTKKNMVIDIIFFILILILIKIPFDLVRDIGYEYVELISTNHTLYTLWNLAFLLIYTITLVCVAIVLIKNFNNKYLNNNDK